MDSGKQLWLGAHSDGWEEIFPTCNKQSWKDL